MITICKNCKHLVIEGTGGVDFSSPYWHCVAKTKRPHIKQHPMNGQFYMDYSGSSDAYYKNQKGKCPDYEEQDGIKRHMALYRNQYWKTGTKLPIVSCLCPKACAFIIASTLFFIWCFSQ